MVNAYKKALERMWTDACTVTEYVAYKKENKITSHKEVVVLENQPCRLSFVKALPSASAGNVNIAVQKALLFIEKDVVIKPGSKIRVVRDGKRAYEYKSSGEPSVYRAHQEIGLDLFEGWT